MENGRRSRYQLAKYDLEAGLDQGKSPIVSEQGPLILENVRHVRHGGIAKRFGLTSLASKAGLVTAKFTNLPLAGLMVNNQTVIQIDSNDQVFPLAKNVDAWGFGTPASQVIARERAHLAWGGTQVSWFDSVQVGTTIVDLWIATNSAFISAGNLYYRIVDANTGDVIIGPSILATGCLRCCLVTCGTTVVALYSTSTTNITGSRLDASSKAGITAGWVGTANLVTTLAVGGALSTHNAYAACPHKTNTDKFYLVYETFAGAVSTLRYSLCTVSTMTVTTTSNGSRSTVDTNILGWAVEHNPTLGKCWFAYSYETGANEIVRMGMFDQTTTVETLIPAVCYNSLDCGGRWRRLTVQSADAASAGSGLVIVGASSDGTVIPTAGVNPAAVVAPATFPIQTRWQVFDSTGAAFTTFPKRLSDCGILSLPFIQNGTYWQWVGAVSDGDVQPTWFLMEIDINDTEAIVTADEQPGLEHARWAPRTAITRDSLVNFGNTIVNVMNPSANKWEVVAPILSGSTRSFLLKRLQADFKHERLFKSKGQISGLAVMDGISLCSSNGRLQELGFAMFPEVPRYTVTGVGGAIAAGTYFYKFIYRTVDDGGNIVRSGDSPPLQVVVGGANSIVTFFWRGLGVTRKQQSTPALGSATQTTFTRTFIEVYRADPGAPSTYYLLNVISDTAAHQSDNRFTGMDPAWSYVDGVAAANAQGFGTIYTLGARLPFLCPPSLRCHKRIGNRLYGLAPDDTVWYSEQEVTGILAQFHPVRTIRAGGGERLTAIAAHRDRGYLIGERNVYSIVGDGLDNAGKGQAPYVQAMNLQGTTDPNAVIESPIGVFYRTSDTIQLLGAGDLELEEYVRQTLTDNPYTFDSVFSSALAEVRWSVGASSTATTGVEIVYSLNRKAFFINKYFDKDQALASAAILNYGLSRLDALGKDVLLLQFAGGKVYYVDETQFMDDGIRVERKVTLPYIRGTVATQLGQVGKVGITTKKQAESNLILEVAYDYSDNYQQVTEFKASGATQPIRRWMASLGGHKCEAFSIQIRDKQPGDGPISQGTGEGDWLLEVGFEVSVDDEMGQLSPLGERG